ncbi:MAG: protein kinase [Chloroflexi bacterium]|nr:protein kinase [Chloroflexota bacterium]
MSASVVYHTEHGTFRILSEIGRGGAAIIYKAETIEADKHIPKFVAVKVLHQHLAQNAEFRERLANEFELLKQLTSRHTPRVYHFGETYMVMELVQGIGLSHVIHRREALPLEQHLDILLQIVAVLRDLYARGILHRDLKPANLVLVSERLVKLLDFGIALELGKSETPREGFLGSPPYLAPERTGLLEGGSNLQDVRAEIYAFGVIAFELFTRQLPFDGDNVWAILRAQVEHPVPSLAAAGVNLPQAVIEMIERCLAKDVTQRFQAPQEVWETLRRFGEKARLGAAGNSQIVFPILKSEVVIGRDDPRFDYCPDIDLSELDKPMHTSRLHARMFETGAGWMLQELPRVRNGTWVNGRRTSPEQNTRLQPGDEISFADVKLIFSIPERSYDA